MKNSFQLLTAELSPDSGIGFQSSANEI